MSQLAIEAPQRNTNWSITLVPIHEQIVDQIRPALYCPGRRGTARPVDRLRQRRQPAAGAQHGAPTRARTPHGARRRARPFAPPDADRERAALDSPAALAGLVLAIAFHRGLLALVADRIPVPRLDQVALDAPVIAFTLALSIVTGLIFGVVPRDFRHRQRQRRVARGRTSWQRAAGAASTGHARRGGGRAFARAARGRGTLDQKLHRAAERGPGHAHRRSVDGARQRVGRALPQQQSRQRRLLHRRGLAHERDSRRDRLRRGELPADARLGNRHQLSSRGSPGAAAG